MKKRNCLSGEVQHQTSKLILSCASRSTAKKNAKTTPISRSVVDVDDTEKGLEGVLVNHIAVPYVSILDTEDIETISRKKSTRSDTVAPISSKLDQKERGVSCSPSMASWRTPHGTLPDSVYTTAVQKATIRWWYAHRRNDLPWRQENRILHAVAEPEVSVSPSCCECLQRASPMSCGGSGGRVSYSPAHGRFVMEFASTSTEISSALKVSSCSAAEVKHTDTKEEGIKEEKSEEENMTVVLGVATNDGVIEKHGATDAGGACKPPDPYAIWVSEVMSQQTQMSTVITYFTTWMQKFPTVEALATSTEAEVRAVWAGMGYYRRALYMLNGARFVVDLWRKENRDGPVQLPATAKALQAVPGIGPYTAAAIASICYREPAVAVDGNLVRVLSRLRAERDFDPKKPQNIKIAFQWGDFLMKGGDSEKSSVAPQGSHYCGPVNNEANGSPSEDGESIENPEPLKKRRIEHKPLKENQKPTARAAAGLGHEALTRVCQDPGALNQGLMEIGARVCKPNGPPLCDQCPLQAYCGAYAAWKAGNIPAIEGVIPLRGAAQPKRVEHVVCVVHEFPAVLDLESSTHCSAPKLKKQATDGHRGKQDSHQNEGDAVHPIPDRAFVVVQRPENVLLGGMLEFPSLPLDCEDEVSLSSKSSGDQDNEEQADKKLVRKGLAARASLPSSRVTPNEGGGGGSAADALAQATRMLGCLDTVEDAPTPCFVGQVSHIFSHIDMTVHVYHCLWSGADEGRPLKSPSTASGFRQSKSASDRKGGQKTGHESGIITERLCMSLAETLAKVNASEEKEEDLVNAFRKRISVLRESEMKKGACSRLMLKVMAEVSKAKLKRSSPFAVPQTRRKK